jgi:hypothetical protein
MRERWEAGDSKRVATRERRWREPFGLALLIDRAARVAFTFVVMNSSAVAGLVAVMLRKKVWRS